MKNIHFFLSLTFFVAIAFTANAQYQTLVLNYEKSCFGENEPLPSNKNFVITGVANTNIPYVEVAIYDSKHKEDDAPVYETFWKRDLNSQSPKFTVPVNQHLRESKSYDVLVKYYRVATDREADALQTNITNTLDAYIDQSYKLSNSNIDFNKSAKKTIADMNEIVITGMSQYRHRTRFTFKSFSDVVEMKIDQIESQSLKSISNANAANGDDAGTRVIFRDKLLTELKEMIRTEVGQYLNRELYIMVDDKYIEDYPTEELQNSLPVNIGYGGALLSTDFNDFNYTAGPYLGLSFPFGKEGSQSKFLQRSSLSFGVILDQNLFDQDNVAYTGPIFGVPVYGALGYRAFRFIRVNAGVTVLENVGTSNIQVHPFIGISAELNLSLSLAKE
ncbi:MAG: hypothetical protein HC803_03380 [Saprospiraceae bacterium]|nr:hypothetical protein [Saprospiraceae bacterium]